MGDALYEFDPTGATEPRLINEGLGLNGFDWWDGYLWAPRMYTGELVRIDVDSGEVTTIADGFTYSTSADVGPDGMVYVNDDGAQQIVKVDPQTGSKTVVAPIGGDNMAISSTGRLFLSNGENARVVEVLPDGTIREVSKPGLTTGGGGIAVAPGADGAPVVYVPDIFGFYAITGDTGVEVPTASGQAFGAMTAGAFGTNVVTTSWFDGTLQVWDPVAGEVIADYSEALTATPINAVGFGEPTVLATMAVPTGLATNGTDLWVADWATSTVSQLIKDGVTIDPVVVASGLAQPEGLAFSPEGQLLVYETGAARVSTVDLREWHGDTDHRRAGRGLPAPAFMPPSYILAGVAVDDAGSIYVSSRGLSSSIRSRSRPALTHQDPTHMRRPSGHHRRAASYAPRHHYVLAHDHGPGAMQVGQAGATPLAPTIATSSSGFRRVPHLRPRARPGAPRPTRSSYSRWSSAACERVCTTAMSTRSAPWIRTRDCAGVPWARPEEDMAGSGSVEVSRQAPTEFAYLPRTPYRASQA